MSSDVLLRQVGTESLSAVAMLSLQEYVNVGRRLITALLCV